MTLQELKNSGTFDVFVEERITQPALIKVGDMYYSQNATFFGNLWQLVFRVTLIRNNKPEVTETSLGPITARRVTLDDLKIFVAEGPYFALLHSTPIENQHMLHWCRDKLWKLEFDPDKLPSYTTLPENFKL